MSFSQAFSTSQTYEFRVDIVFTTPTGPMPRRQHPANPRPLPIDGHAYRACSKRRKARR